MPNPPHPASDRQVVQFSHVVSKLIMARERIAQAYRPNRRDRAADPFLVGGTNLDGEMARAYEIMDEACAKWFARPSRKTAETAARGERIAAMNREKLKKANAAKAVSGNKGGRPPKERS